MRLVKDGMVMVSEDETVIRAYKLNGFVEEAEKVEVAPKTKPAKATKK